MGKFITILISLFLPVVVQAQANSNWFRDGVSWIQIQRTVYPGAEDETRILTLEGDTVAGDVNALKLYGHQENPDSCKELMALLHTDGDKVFFMSMRPQAIEKEWLLMYDFGLKPGEGCYVYDFSYFDKDKGYLRQYVKCTGTETDKYYPEAEVMYLEGYADDSCSDDYPDKGEWIKGIGSTKGVTWNCRFELDGVEGYLKDVSCSGKPVYSLSMTEVGSPEYNAPVITVRGNEVQLSGINGQTQVYAASVDGVVTFNRMVEEDNLNITMPNKGLYVVKIGDTVHKLILK